MTRAEPSSMAARALILHSDDNVATALDDLKPGELVPLSIGEAPVRLLAAIPFGHKFSVRPIRAGSLVIKYGEAIGVASTDIASGEHAHVHNVASARARGDLEASQPCRS